MLGYSFSYSRPALARADTFIGGVLAEWMSVPYIHTTLNMSNTIRKPVQYSAMLCITNITWHHLIYCNTKPFLLVRIMMKMPNIIAGATAASGGAGVASVAPPEGGPGGVRVADRGGRRARAHATQPLCRRRQRRRLRRCVCYAKYPTQAHIHTYIHTSHTHTDKH